jgi:SAM-dependent methyltransferase
MRNAQAVSQSSDAAAAFGLTGPGEILDACCGGRMWWWDKAHPLAIYMDVRRAPKGSVGELTGRPEWNPNFEVAPTCLGDFRNMPFADDSFQLVVFDPPHIVRPEPVGINGLKYGALPAETEQDDLGRGFAECWRVIRPGGTLVFKWAGSLARVEPHFPATPIVGTRSLRQGSGLGTRWIIFYKPLAVSQAEVERAA